MVTQSPHLAGVLAQLPTDRCVIWPGTPDRLGYCRFRYKGGPKRMAHRIIYEIVVGPIPDGLTLDHLRDRCSSRACVNPAHMDPCTQAENALRGDGIPAINARKTTCLLGHPFDKEYGGERVCSTCARRRYTAWRRRQGLQES